MTSYELERLPIPQPDHYDRRQAERQANGWPRHKSRRRNRRRTERPTAND